MTTTILDIRGLSCPLPIIQTTKAMRDMPAGGVLQVLASDPGALADLEAFCSSTGNELVGWQDDAGVVSVSIRKIA